MSGEERQIQSMIDFIEREADEKIQELKQMAEEEYDTEKMRLVESEKAKVRADAEKKKKNIEIQQRVARANHTKEQRVRLMEERARLLEELKASTRKKVGGLINDKNKYKQLMADLLLQSVVAIQADSNVFVRKADEQVARALLKETETAYEKKTGKKVSLTLSKDSLDEEESWGGVVLKTLDGKIICNNALAYRAESVFKEQLPTVRYLLFNDEASVN